MLQAKAKTGKGEPDWTALIGGKKERKGQTRWEHGWLLGFTVNFGLVVSRHLKAHWRSYKHANNAMVETGGCDRIPCRLPVFFAFLCFSLSLSLFFLFFIYGVEIGAR